MRQLPRLEPALRRRAPERAAPREDAAQSDARETGADKDTPVPPQITDWASL